MPSMFLGKWVYLTTNLQEGAFKAKIVDVVEEAGQPLYLLVLPDGSIDSVFVADVHGIRPIVKKKGKVIRFFKRKTLRLIK